jgi:hypothetical protein
MTTYRASVRVTLIIAIICSVLLQVANQFLHSFTIFREFPVVLVVRFINVALPLLVGALILLLEPFL